MIKDLWKKYEELIMYVVFGALTTLVNFAAFMLFSKLLGEDLYLVTNGIAWIISVIFAYITNLKNMSKECDRTIRMKTVL